MYSRVISRCRSSVFSPVLSSLSRRILSRNTSNKTEMNNGHIEETVTLKFKKLSKNAYTPTRGSMLAAGYDLYSANDYLIPPQGKELVFTDIQIAVPHGHYGRVAPRSGLAWKHFIDVGAGVIDEDYRGNVGVILFNFGQEPFKVNKGDRVAQLICEKISYPRLQEVENLEDTERGVNGFGSTGKH